MGKEIPPTEIIEHTFSKLFDSKYFTPDISDIRVGYECEYLVNNSDQQWVSYIHGKYKGEENKIIGQSFINLLRVPYLTKEQIRGEGWAELNKDYETNEFVKGVYSLDYDFHNKLLRIYISDNFETSGYDRQFFEGRCKDINTFRYICKLLEI